MSSYHTSFTYLDKNSYDDFNLQIVHFEGGDSGETESYLSQDSIYADSPRGTKRTLYGTKYNSVATLDITVMRPDGAEFSITKTRELYKWLTGATQYSWIDLWVGDEVKYRMYGFVQNVRPYKLDSRVVGFIISVESNSPWCYSPLVTKTMEINGSRELQIDNPSDDLYTYTQMTTVFKNTGEALTIYNDALNETTTINGLAENEIITLSENMLITSDKEERVFGNSFNYVWPKLKSGINNLVITGTGEITFKYIYCIKVGDCVAGLNASSDPVCDDDGNIILDMLPWERISGKPSLYTTNQLYTRTEVDNKIKAVSNSVYTKDEVDTRLKNLVISDDEVSTLSWYKISDVPTTLSGFKLDEEVNTLLSSVKVEIDEEALNTMLAEILV